MRTFSIVAASILAAAMVSASAETSPAQLGPATPAVKTGPADISETPVAGADRFMRRKATSRIEAQGYGAVEYLRKDRAGVWRGMAKKDGRLVPVRVDDLGNVSPPNEPQHRFARSRPKESNHVSYNFPVV